MDQLGQSQRRTEVSVIRSSGERYTWLLGPVERSDAEMTCEWAKDGVLLTATL